VSDEARRIALAQAHNDLIYGAAVVALERADGTMTYPASEYEAIAERFGGREHIGIEVRASMGPNGPESRLTLVRRDGEAPPPTRLI
jgi:hypothetical protein